MYFSWELSDWPSLGFVKLAIRGNFCQHIGKLFLILFFLSTGKVLWWGACREKVTIVQDKQTRCGAFPQWIVGKSLHKQEERLFWRKVWQANRIPISPVINSLPYLARVYSQAPWICCVLNKHYWDSGKKCVLNKHYWDSGDHLRKTWQAFAWVAGTFEPVKTVAKEYKYTRDPRNVKEGYSSIFKE